MLIVNVAVQTRSGREFPVKRSITIRTTGLASAIFEDIILGVTFFWVMYLSKYLLGINDTASMILSIFIIMALALKILNVAGSKIFYISNYDSDDLRKIVHTWMDELDEDIAGVT